MPEAVHPGSFVGDSIEEWKKLPTWGKVAAVAVVGVVIYLAIRARNAASTTNSTGMTGTPSTSPTQQGLPSFPYGTTALNDANGNPIGTIQPPPPTPPTPPGTPPPPPPPPPGTKPPPPTTLFFSNVTHTGPEGRLWGQLLPGQAVPQGVAVNSGWLLLTGGVDPSQGPTSLQKLGIPYQLIAFFQGNPPHTSANMSNLMTNNSTGNSTHYTQNAQPHTSNAGSYLGIAQTRPVGESIPYGTQGEEGNFGPPTAQPVPGIPAKPPNVR